MAENSKIEWTDHTFNPWLGCQKVGPGCDHCYAEARDIRFTGGAMWGPHAARQRTSEANWRLPMKWNREAMATHTRKRVFCASLADVFDNAVDPTWREDLWRLIWETPHLDWLLLTKRPGNIADMLPKDGLDHPGWKYPWPNVWLGCTVVNQVEAERDVPKMLEVRAKVRFLSIEPMLGPIDLDTAWHGESALASECWGDCSWCDAGHPAMHNCQRGKQSAQEYSKGRSGIDWVIVGGESGPHVRPMHPDWARALRDQCAAAGVPFFFKQWGEYRPPQTDGERESVRDGHGFGGSLLPSGVFGDPRGNAVVKVGKKLAGRLLDGREHNDMPGVL